MSQVVATRGMTRILSNLYVGDESDSLDLKQMTDNKIKYVVRVDDDPKSTEKVHVDPEPKYMFIDACDSPHTQLWSNFRSVNDFIHEARLGGNAVLVHCFAGVSRSVTLATAYLMSATKYGRDDAFRVMKYRRSIANPNEGFWGQLKMWEVDIKEERKRLRDKFSLAENEDKLGDNKEMEEALRLAPPLVSTDPPIEVPCDAKASEVML